MAVAPLVELSHLDHLWFQVAGTRCNLTCHHCFISCSPHNHSFGFLSREQVEQALEESIALGVKEYYFTGGEPFLHPQLTELLCLALEYGPTTVLTNGTVLKPAWLERLREAQEASRYSLEFRVSIDGLSPEMNDPIRGEGTFARAMRGVAQLVEHGFLPIITAARTWPESEDLTVLRGFEAVLREIGYNRPRIKLVPTLRLGAEEHRTQGYLPAERVDEQMLEGFDHGHLICEHSRVVTDRGVYVCPILIEQPDARLGSTLAESQVGFRLSHGACYTCYQYGAICSNPSEAR